MPVWQKIDNPRKSHETKRLMVLKEPSTFGLFAEVQDQFLEYFSPRNYFNS